MVQNTIRTSATRAELRQLLATLPRWVVSGGTAAANDMLTRIGLAILGRVKRAFVVKARGGTDEAGGSWAPLKPATIAYSRRGRTKAEKKRNTRPSQALTIKQSSRWWDVYRRSLARFRGDKGRAARMAWAILKAEGATTLLAKYGGRSVEILRDTGLLLNSLSPGVQSGEQVFRAGRGEIVIGTNRRGAAAHHRGIPGKLPQRRLWPPPQDWSQSWWDDVLEVVKQGVLEIAVQLIRNSR